MKKRPEDRATEEILGRTQGGCNRLALKKGWLDMVCRLAAQKEAKG